jgi:glutathione peroxidase
VTDRPGFTHRRERRGLIGPFGGRQLLGGALVILVSAVLLVIVTTPLGTPGGLGPGDPQATQFVLGPAPTNGLRVGEIAPEFVVPNPGGGTAYLADLHGQPVQLADLRGKAVWINFWASWCPPCQSETPVLRDLAERYRDRGLVVLGFPSNDFEQESGGNKQIADFCQNTYGVKFPMFSKSSVRGADANPLYRQLAQATGRQPLWNFHKYLVGRDGSVVANYTSLTAPDDKSLVRDIEKSLAAK